MRKILILFVFFITFDSLAQVKDFSLVDVRNNSTVNLSDFASKKAVVILFTSNVCPYAVYYEGRITQLVADYASKNVQFLLINSHKEPKESNEEMANKVSTWGIDVPYLADKTQKVMQQLGARKSPEVFLLRSNNNGFSVFYKGAIDNNPQVANDVKNQYLKKNLEALLSGQSPISSSRPVGCIIKG